MQLGELLDIFFERSKENEAYGTEDAYELDQLRFLDMLLTIACSMKYLDGDGEPPIEIENIHLRGVPITGNEVLQALQENAVDKAESLPFEEIRDILQKAVKYRKNRIKQTTIPIRFEGLIEKLHFSGLESFFLMLAYANFLDAKYELLYAFLQGDVRMKLPSVRLGISLYELFETVDAEELGRFSNQEGSLFDVMLEMQERYDSIRLAQTYTLSEKAYSWLCGTDTLQSKLKKYATVIPVSMENVSIPIRLEECRRVKNVMDAMEAETKKGCQVLNIYGYKGNGRRFSIQYALSSSGKKGIYIDVVELLKSTDMEEILRKVYQEWMLSEFILCFVYPVYQKADDEKDAVSSIQIQQLISYCKLKFPFFVWISEDKAEYLLEQNLKYIALEIPSLSIQERYQFWCEKAKAYPVSEDVDYRLMANQYILSMKGIQDALWNADLFRKSEQREKIEAADIKNAVKQQSVSQLGRCAHLIPSVYTWKDLVLQEETRHQLEMICNHVKYKNVVGEEWGFYEKTAYGRGICALFSGAPGTGKTMAVQVIANELGLNLYRIDLSQLISKYIGETEKNISKVFERAREINALLFFDEADSLFARRLDVRDSMDRSANAQTAHLLQEIEDYDGITILATNLAMNIDDAFKRRIRFMVKFAFPAEEVRLELWKSILPEKMPCEEELDLSYFAEKFELSGSSIKEVLTCAAFFAAAEQRKLANKDIIEAIKQNYSKYGKTLTNEEFGYLI